MSGNMPVLALRGIAVYPDQTIHFDVGRIKSVLALEAAMRKDQIMMLVPQKDIIVDDPNLKDLYNIGTVVSVKQILKSQGDTIRILVNGIHRARLLSLSQSEPFLAGEVEAVEDSLWNDNLRMEALRREAVTLFNSYLEFVEKPAQAVQLRMMSSKDCGFIADSIAQHASFDYKEKAKLLCQLNPVRRLEHTIVLLRKESILLEMESDIHEKTRANMDQQQRDYYLREQIKVIREELGEGDENSECGII